MNTNNYNSEIDLKKIFGSLIRNKLSLLIFTLISTIVCFSYASTLKPIWRGNFNILVSNQKKQSNDTNLDTNAILSQLKITNNISGDGETQRLILSSPFVLGSVYDYVIDYKERNSQNSNLTFKSWMSSIEIAFESNSTVLNITHDNSDKLLLLKTLELIATKYKEYSKREQVKNIEKTKLYLEDQIAIMSKKAADSKKRYNKFSIENNLGTIDGFISYQENNLNSPNNILKDVKNYSGSRYESQFRLLNEKEAEFNNLSQYLKPNSETLNSLKVDIEFLKTSLKRPTEILIRNEELATESVRNSSLLLDLQRNLELIKLEEIKTPDPWQLISDPIISRRPISLSKKKKFYFSLLGSFFLGCIFVLIKEKYSGFIYYKSDFESKLKIKSLETLNKNQVDLSTKILKNSIMLNTNFPKDKVIGIVNFDSKADIEFMKKPLSKNSNLIFLDLTDKRIEDIEKIFLIFEKGKCKFDDLDLVNQYLSLYKEKIVGWFYVC